VPLPHSSLRLYPSASRLKSGFRGCIWGTSAWHGQLGTVEPTCGMAEGSDEFGSHHGVPGTSTCWPTPCWDDDGGNGVTDCITLAPGPTHSLTTRANQP
jgi:hypothetical protein